MNHTENALKPKITFRRLRAFYLFIANYFATQIIGGTKELVVLLRLSGDINNELKE